MVVSIIKKMGVPGVGGGGMMAIMWLCLGQTTYIWRGDLTENILRYRFGGLIFGGAYTWRSLFSEFYGIRTVNRRVGRKL